MLSLKSVELGPLLEEQARMETSAAAYETILDQLAEGVIVADAAGRITMVNHAASTIHGVTRLDVAPDEYSETYQLYTEDGQAYVSRDLPLARAVRGETVKDARWRIRRPDGTEVLAIGNARPLRDHDGRQIGAVLTVRDDTAREAAERSLRELNAALAEHVAERTREATTAQAAAEKAQARAEAASGAKSEFLAAMSHEIRTPLNGIMGYADLLLEEASISPAVRLHGERILSAGSALLTVVNDILDFAKVEAGEIDLAPEPFAPGALADEALAIVRASAMRKGLELRVEARAGLPGRVVGDRSRLRQVLLNLLNNAIKFTASGSVDLIVDVSAAGAGVKRLRFAVRDTGIGIPASKRHLLFERFSQIDGTTQREFGGTGLGLAISKRLIDLMDGKIDVISETGRGSTFWFEIDLPLAASTPASGPVAVTRAEGTPRRLLLVEDVVLNQELACAVLRRGGHEVDVVSGGREAVAAVQATRYDLVLMDVQMPGVDGITATRMIRALDHAAANVPIVAMTANVLPHQIEAVLAAGMQAHVGKPFKRDALLATIDRWASTPAAEPSPATDDEGLDHAALAALDAMVGHEVLVHMLAGLAAELNHRFGADETTPDRDTLAFDAHAMKGALGSLGFAALAAQCVTVETACKAGEAYTAPLTALHDMRRRALRQIEALRAG